MKTYIAILTFCLPFWGMAQTVIDLETIIAKAQENSPDAIAAETRADNSNWTYKSYRADLLPSIQMNGTLPNFNSTITALDQDDGSQQFISRTLNTSLANVSLNQNIGATGGSISMTTGLQRIDVFGDNSSTSYLSTPLNIGFSQDLFAFNQFKWMRQTEPMKLKEAQRRYYEDMEDVAIRAVNLYFNYYDAQIAIQLAKLNKANSDTLYQISKGRYQLGKIAEHELLQMQLNRLNAQKNLRQARIDLSNASAELQNYTGIEMSKDVSIVPPVLVDTFSVSEQRALEMALLYRADVVNMDRQLIEAEQSMAQAKNSATPNISLNASYGLRGSDALLTDAYGNTLPQQQFTAGFSIPITNWGKGRAQLKIAESNMDLTNIQVNNQRLNFEQEVLNQVNQFNFRKREYIIAAISDTIGQKQYEIAYKRFLIGKIDITDLNIALQGKDQAKRSYLGAMRNYWLDYYRLRKLTLYDFQLDAPLLSE